MIDPGFEFFILAPRPESGYFVRAYGNDRAELGATAQLMADTHGHALICKRVEEFADQGTHNTEGVDAGAAPSSEANGVAPKKARKKRRPRAI